jgi:hypothetical protein
LGNVHAAKNWANFAVLTGSEVLASEQLPRNEQWFARFPLETRAKNMDVVRAWLLPKVFRIHPSKR